MIILACVIAALAIFVFNPDVIFRLILQLDPPGEFWNKEHTLALKMPAEDRLDWIKLDDVDDDELVLLHELTGINVSLYRIGETGGISELEETFQWYLVLRNDYRGIQTV